MLSVYPKLNFHEDTPLINCQIDNYEFFHENTPTQCGGVGIYVKSTHNPTKITKFSGSHHKVSESVFVEINIKTKKKLLIGCIYRHPSSAVSEFIDEFFQSTLKEITQEEKKMRFSRGFQCGFDQIRRSPMCQYLL